MKAETMILGALAVAALGARFFPEVVTPRTPARRQRQASTKRRTFRGFDNTARTTTGIGPSTDPEAERLHRMSQMDRLRFEWR